MILDDPMFQAVYFLFLGIDLGILYRQGRKHEIHDEERRENGRKTG